METNRIYLNGREEKIGEALAETEHFAEENGLKNGQILWPLRTAVSGKQMTPGGATELMEILGREESLIRIKAGIELLKDSIG